MPNEIRDLPSHSYIDDFNHLNKTDKALTIGITFAAALITLPFLGVGGVIAFRWSATHFATLEKTENKANDLLARLNATESEISRLFVKVLSPDTPASRYITEQQFKKDGDKVRGVITFNDGMKYEGTFEDDLSGGLISGEGKLTIPIPEAESGNLTKPDRIIYEGIFKNGRLIEGKKSEGDTYVKGMFNENDQLHGEGERYHSRTGILMKGTFDHDILTEGEWKDKNGTTKNGKFAKGKLLEGQIKGKGFYYDGIFDNNEHLLKGEMLATNGIKYHGRYENNQLSGEGWKEFPDKTRLTGSFENNNLVLGTITMPNGRILKGECKKAKINRGNGIIEEGIFIKSRQNLEGLVTKTESKKKILEKEERIKGNEEMLDELFGRDVTEIEGSTYNREVLGKEKEKIEDEISTQPQESYDDSEYTLVRGKRRVGNTVFEGNFVDGKLEGDGKMTLKDDSVLTGHFSADVFTKGTLTYKGQTYEGALVDEQLKDYPNTIALGAGMVFKFKKES